MRRARTRAGPASDGPSRYRAGGRARGVSRPPPTRSRGLGWERVGPPADATHFRHITNPFKEGRPTMANYTAADVKRPRDLTGCGMMDCKKARDESAGDYDEAVQCGRAKAAN